MKEAKKKIYENDQRKQQWKPNQTKPNQNHRDTSTLATAAAAHRTDGNESKTVSGKTTKDSKKHGTFFKIAFEMYRLVEQINEV